MEVIVSDGLLPYPILLLKYCHSGLPPGAGGEDSITGFSKSRGAAITIN